MTIESLDESALLEECDEDMEVLAVWLEMFDRDCQKRLPKLREAVQGQDYETLMNEAHALKGGLGVLFAKAAFESAYKLETMGKNEEIAEADATLRQLEAEIETLRQDLQALIQS